MNFTPRNLTDKATILCICLLMLYVSPLTLSAQETVSDPDPNRFKAEINAFKEWDSKNSFPENAILFVGSSSIRFWKTHKAFPEYSIINRGFGGSHITDVEYFYEQVIGKYRPDAIIFYAGDNDISAGKSSDRVIEDYQKLLNRVLQDIPDIEWIYIPIKPSSSRWDHWQRMQEVNNWVKNHHRENSRLHYVDLANPLLNDAGKPDDTLFLDDLLHLNEEGYAVWNQIMEKKLNKIND